MKTYKHKCYLNNEALEAYIGICKAAKYPYKIIMSNYTSHLFCAGLDIDILFMNSFQSKRMFIGFQMIKTDFEKWTANEIPVIDYNDVLFFENEIRQDTELDNVTNLDLTSAYATVLRNDYFIQEKTYKYLQGIPKVDRLACVGMFASRKTIFEYSETGEIANYEIIQSPTTGYFTYCIKVVGDLMLKIKEAIGSSFLQFWVDGVYINSEDAGAVAEAKRIIEAAKFQYKEKLIPKFRAKILDNKKINVQLWQTTDNRHLLTGQYVTELKEFNFPKPQTEFQKAFKRYLEKDIKTQLSKIKCKE